MDTDGACRVVLVQRLGQPGTVMGGGGGGHRPFADQAVSFGGRDMKRVPEGGGRQANSRLCRARIERISSPVVLKDLVALPAQPTPNA